MTDSVMARVPPHSPQIEAAVLCAWSTLDRFGKSYRPEPELFHVPDHRRIAAAMAKLPTENRDEASIQAQLDADGTLADVEPGAVYRVLTCVAEPGDPWAHVQKLREYKSLRDMIGLVNAACAEAYQDKSLGGMVGKLQEAMRAGATGIGTQVYSEKDLFRQLAKDMIGGVERKKISTGIPSLDHDIGGYFEKTVSVFGGATSFGKTSYGLYLYDQTVGAGKRALMVSFEDPRELCARRLLARRAKVRAAALRDNRVGEENGEWSRVLEAAEHAGTFPFFLEAIGWTVERAATEIACICASEDIALVEVDYLQKIRCAEKKQDRRNEVGYIASVLTDAVKTSVSGAAGVFFSQLRRPLAPGEKPGKHMLKEAGELENGAENVLIGYFDKDNVPVIKLEKGKDGCAGHEYRMKWNEVWCGFEGELADGDGWNARHDTTSPEARRATKSTQHWHDPQEAT